MPTRPQSLPVAALLARVALAPRQFHKSLTLWPLVRRADAPASNGPTYVSLADALDAGDLCVDEVDEGGSVPHVLVRNSGERAVLVLFGEELRGAKQNRIANASFLVPAGSDLEIDVSCVEQGRWGRRRHAGFESSARVASQRLRQKMSLKVAASKAAGVRGFAADQTEVWDEVRERLHRSGVRSPTASYEDYALSRGSDVEEICAAFRTRADQVGFVAAIGEEIVGAEAIGRPDVFERVFPRLLRGYAIDASDTAVADDAPSAPRLAPSFTQPEEFLASLRAAPVTGSPSLGTGEDLRIGGGAVVGCALVDGEVVHLTAFPAEAL